MMLNMRCKADDRKEEVRKRQEADQASNSARTAAQCCARIAVSLFLRNQDTVQNVASSVLQSNILQLPNLDPPHQRDHKLLLFQ